MQARRTDHLTDWIQEACIRRMIELGLNAERVADLVAGHIERDHAVKYLTRRAPMVSHKLQHLLAALRLRIAPE